MKKLSKQHLHHIFLYIHDWIYFCVYYCTLSLLYALDFFHGNTQLIIKIILRCWVIFPATLFLLSCYQKCVCLFKKSITQDNHLKRKRIVQIVLTILALTYLIVEMVRFFEIFIKIGFSSIRDEINFSISSISISSIMICSTIICGINFFDSIKDYSELSPDSKNLLQAKRRIFCKLITLFSYILYVIGYIIGDLEKQSIIGPQNGPKIIKLSIFMISSFIGLIVSTFSLYDNLSISHIDTSIDIQSTMPQDFAHCPTQQCT